MSDDALETKVRGLCEPVVAAAATDELIAAVRRFDDLHFLDDIDRAIRHRAALATT